MGRGDIIITATDAARACDPDMKKGGREAALWFAMNRGFVYLRREIGM